MDGVSAFHVLFVCIGNVCRSPVGERLLRARLPEDRFEVHSAGLNAMVDSEMSPDSAALLEGYGGSADGFRSRQLTESMVHESDLVLAATMEIRSRVLSESPGALRRTFTVLEFAALLDLVDGATPGELVAAAATARSNARLDDYDIPDPWQRNATAHEEAARLMADAVERIAKALDR